MTQAEFGLELSKPRVVMTKRGERFVRSASPNEAFWDAWRANKEMLKAAGWSVSKYEGEWQVAHWAETMPQADRAAAHEASRAATADIEIPMADGTELRPFQKAGVAYALPRVGTLIADEMGLGKTVQAIAVCNATAPKRILIVAPASVLVNWRNEIKRFQTLNLPVFVIRPKHVFTGEPDGWYVINYEIVGKFEEQLRRQEWDVVIMDECHYIKTPTAKRTRLLVGGPKTKTQEKAEPLPAKRKILLTGTPIMNRPAELFSLLHYLDAARWPSRFAFERRYCAGGYNGFGFEAKGASNLNELQARLRETVMVRRLKADVLTELPAKQRQIISIEPDSDEVRELIDRENAEQERLDAEIAQATYEVQTAEASGSEVDYKAAVAKLKQAQAIAFERMAAVRHEVALAKLPYVIEHLAATTAGKVLVFAHHHDVINGLVEALQPEGVVSITGHTKNEDRQPIVDRFQTDPSIRFFVGGMKAAGLGLTLTAASHVVFAEIDWTPSTITQAEDRAHRIGQAESVTVQHVVLDGSIDAKMAKMVVEKQEVIDRSLDNKIDRPVAAPISDVQAVREEIAAQVTRAPVEVPFEDHRQRPVALFDLTQNQVAAIHEALRVVAGYDTDRARFLNGVGFSRYDTDFGCKLAAQSYLTPRQAVVARKLARKYHRQYSVELFQRIFPETMAGMEG
jgi:SWI/SNF-related matrix-associated actin-dependent regulator 1 of chromatin subfamily A